MFASGGTLLPCIKGKGAMRDADAARVSGDALLAAMARPSWAGVAPGSGGLAEPSDLWRVREARARFAALGPEGWLEEQLALPPEDAGLEARLTAARLRISYPAGDNGEGGHGARSMNCARLTRAHAAPEALLRLLDWTIPMDFAERARPAMR